MHDLDLAVDNWVSDCGDWVTKSMGIAGEDGAECEESDVQAGGNCSSRRRQHTGGIWHKAKVSV